MSSLGFLKKILLLDINSWYIILLQASDFPVSLNLRGNAEKGLTI